MLIKIVKSIENLFLSRYVTKLSITNNKTSLALKTTSKIWIHSHDIYLSDIDKITKDRISYEVDWFTSQWLLFKAIYCQRSELSRYLNVWKWLHGLQKNELKWKLPIQFLNLLCRFYCILDIYSTLLTSFELYCVIHKIKLKFIFNTYAQYIGLLLFLLIYLCDIKRYQKTKLAMSVCFVYIYRNNYTPRTVCMDDYQPYE